MSCFNKVKIFFLFGIILFMTPPSYSIITYDGAVAGVNNYSSCDSITWYDSKGWPRTVYFGKVRPVDPTYVGFITRMTWYTDNGMMVTGDEADPNHSHSWGTVRGRNIYRTGFGYTINHDLSGNVSRQFTHGTNFQQSVIFQGDNHLIYRVTFDQAENNTSANRFKVTVDWFFKNGDDKIEYAITYDASPNYVSDDNPYQNDSRSPYFSFDWDGDGTTGDNEGGTSTIVPISGCSFADGKVFHTSDMLNWTYGGSSKIPYVWSWMQGNITGSDTVTRSYNAELGLVQTVSTNIHIGGGPNGGIASSGTNLPGDIDTANAWKLPYQLNAYQSWKGNRLTWQLPYNYVDGENGETTPPYQSYTVSILLDKRTEKGVTNLIVENQNIMAGNVTFSAVAGTILTSGPEGVGNPNTKTYSHVGYDDVYRTWEMTASTNVAEFNFNLASFVYKSPVFVIKGFTASVKPDVVSNTLLNVRLSEGSDYLCSLDDANDSLYLTLIGDVTGNNRIRVAFSGLPIPLAPTTFHLDSTSSNALSFSWTDNATNESAYLVYWSITTTRPSAAGMTLSSNLETATINGLNSSTLYYVWVIASNSYGKSSALSGSGTTTSGFFIAPAVFLIDDFTDGNTTANGDWGTWSEEHGGQVADATGVVSITNDSSFSNNSVLYKYHTSSGTWTYNSLTLSFSLRDLTVNDNTNLSFWVKGTGTSAVVLEIYTPLASSSNGWTRYNHSLGVLPSAWTYVSVSLKSNNFSWPSWQTNGVYGFTSAVTFANGFAWKAVTAGGLDGSIMLDNVRISTTNSMITPSPGILNVHKSYSNTTLGGLVSPSVPGATVRMNIRATNVGGTSLSKTILYDQISSNVTYSTNSIVLGTGWSVEYSTNQIPDQFWSSGNYSASLLWPKSSVRWIRWKHDSFPSGGRVSIFYDIIIR